VAQPITLTVLKKLKSRIKVATVLSLFILFGGSAFNTIATGYYFFKETNELANPTPILAGEEESSQWTKSDNDSLNYGILVLQCIVIFIINEAVVGVFFALLLDIIDQLERQRNLNFTILLFDIQCNKLSVDDLINLRDEFLDNPEEYSKQLKTIHTKLKQVQ
jgi:ABC-type sugar transport system permease subunit